MSDTTNTQVSSEESTNTRSEFAIYWHPACCKHDIKDHPEQPARVKNAIKVLKENFPEEYFRQASFAKKHHLTLFHSETHVDGIFTSFDYAETNRGAIVRIDGDTRIMYNTRDASMRSVGSIVDAIDDAYSQPDSERHIKRAFCCVRPPGHHAERGASMGFCYFNNAAIGAKYAQSKYGVKKVAVVDFDVHHGNGTEEGFIPDENLFYGSTHERGAYPGTGKDPSPLVGEKAANPLHRRIVNREIRPFQQSRIDFRKLWQEVMDEMYLFAPELIIISAGFDAHDDDPLANSELVEEDYAWATEAVLKVARKLSPNDSIPVLSILEGGYDIEALGRSILTHCKVLETGLSKDWVESESQKSREGTGDEVAALIAHMESLGLVNHNTSAAQAPSQHEDVEDKTDKPMKEKKHVSWCEPEEMDDIRDALEGIELAQDVIDETSVTNVNVILAEKQDVDESNKTSSDSQSEK